MLSKIFLYTNNWSKKTYISLWQQLIKGEFNKFSHNRFSFKLSIFTVLLCIIIFDFIFQAQDCNVCLKIFSHANFKNTT
jgi:hypothetical protein